MEGGDDHDPQRLRPASTLWAGSVASAFSLIDFHTPPSDGAWLDHLVYLSLLDGTAVALDGALRRE